MKFRTWTWLLLLPSFLAAQDPDHIRVQVIEIRKKRMADELNLSKDIAPRFMTIYSDHLDRMHELLEGRREVFVKLHHASELEDEIRGDRVLALVYRLQAMDDSLLRERHSVLKRLESVLTPPQMARYVVFESRFDDKVRETLMFIRKKRPHFPRKYEFQIEEFERD